MFFDKARKNLSIFRMVRALLSEEAPGSQPGFGSRESVRQRMQCSLIAANRCSSMVRSRKMKGAYLLNSASNCFESGEN